ncbi:MAG: hypothetical protein JW772_02760, partial [Candidatus Diapherotrites archaeon]|nr:hypothetical protein [Candidatus Diapherotrites archaeon]
NITGTIISEKIIDATPTQKQILDTLKQHSLEQLMNQASNIRENYQIERRIIISEKPNGDRITTIVLTVANLREFPLTGLTILEEVPKNIASNAREITAGNEIIILKEDPLVEFIAVGKLAKETSFSYSVNKEITDLSNFKPAIILNHTIAQDLTCANGCDDKNPCTTDKCVNETCVYFLKNDGTPCGYAQKCMQGICIAYPTTPHTERPLIMGMPKEIVITALIAIIVIVLIAQFYTRKIKTKKQKKKK